MKKFRSVLLLAIFILVACAPVPPVAPEEANINKETCVPAESDNAFRWGDGSCIPIDTSIYYVQVQVAGFIANNQTVNGSISGVSVNGTGSVSGSVWTEGKGVLPVRLISVSPAFPGLDIGDLIILKTTDLKAMGLPVGAVATFMCNKDGEASSPLYAGQVLTTDRITYELDACRMTSPEFTLTLP